VEGPLQETLAAALVMATGWHDECTFINPMCGSGTLAIEAALMGLNRPAAILRENFGFMHLKGFNPGYGLNCVPAQKDGQRTDWEAGSLQRT